MNEYLPTSRSFLKLRTDMNKIYNGTVEEVSKINIIYVFQTEEQLETKLEEEKDARQQGTVHNVFDILTQTDDTVKEDELIMVNFINFIL